MIRPARLAAAAVLSSAVVLGAVAPAAAAPADSPRKVHVTKTSKPAKPVKSVKVSKEARRLAAEQTKVAREISRKDAFLGRVLGSDSLATLDSADTIGANIVADRALLDSYRAPVASATTLSEVRTVAADVSAVRPEVYRILIGGLVAADEAAATVAANEAVLADLAAQADAKELEGFDVTDVRAVLDAAVVANIDAGTAADAVRLLAEGVTATSPRGDLKALHAALETAADALEVVAEQVLVAEEALLAAPVSEPVVEPAPEPVVEPAPVEETPTDEAPVEEAPAEPTV